MKTFLQRRLRITQAKFLLCLGVSIVLVIISFILTIGVGITQNPANTFSSVSLLAAVANLLTLIILVILVWYFNQFIRKPFSTILTYSKKIADDDVNDRLELPNQPELSQLAEQLNLIAARINNLVQSLRIASQLPSVADSLRLASMEQSSNANEQVMFVAQVGTSINELSGTASNISENASQVAVASKVTLEQAHIVSSSTSEVSKVVHELENSIENARNSLEKANEDFNYFIEQMSQFDTQNSSIETIISIIGALTKEIHLLSLNASIEAAGAGEIGARFQVVAREFKALAARSVEATENIKNLTGTTRTSLASVQAETRLRQQSMQEAMAQNAEVENVVQQALEKVTINENSVYTILQAAENSALLATQIKTTAFQQKSATQQILESTTIIDNVAKQGLKSSETLVNNAISLDKISNSFVEHLNSVKLDSVLSLNASNEMSRYLPVGGKSKSGEQDSNRRLRAAFCTPALGLDINNSWNDQGKAVAETWAKWFGVDLSYYGAMLKVERQIADLKEIASQQWDFVVIQAMAVDTLADSVEKLLANNIPVIQIDTHIDSTNKLNITSSIEPDNVYMGRVVADYLFQKMGGHGKVIMTQGSLGHTGSQGRAKGFMEALANYPNIELLAEDATEWNPYTAESQWKQYLKKFPQIDGAFFHNDALALAAAEVIKESGRKIMLAGVDAMPKAIEAVVDGTLLTTVRNPSGRIHWGGLLVGIMAATGVKDIPRYILADGPVVTKENAQGLLFMENQFLL